MLIHLKFWVRYEGLGSCIVISTGRNDDWTKRSKAQTIVD